MTLYLHVICLCVGGVSVGVDVFVCVCVFRGVCVLHGECVCVCVCVTVNCCLFITHYHLIYGLYTNINVSNASGSILVVRVYLSLLLSCQ